MSRVGKKPVPLPKGVKVTVGDQIQVEGPKGKLAVPLPAGVRLKQTDGRLELEIDGGMVSLELANIDKARLVPKFEF